MAVGRYLLLLKFALPPMLTLLSEVEPPATKLPGGHAHLHGFGGNGADRLLANQHPKRCVYEGQRTCYIHIVEGACPSNSKVRCLAYGGEGRDTRVKWGRTMSGSQFNGSRHLGPSAPEEHPFALQDCTTWPPTIIFSVCPADTTVVPGHFLQYLAHVAVVPAQEKQAPQAFACAGA